MAVFDIIIPTYNNCAELRKCLLTLEHQIFTDFRVLICIDGSTDDTLYFLKDYHPIFQIKILQHDDGKNHGRNPARNLALPHIASEFILFIDSDIELRSDCLQRHYELLSKRDCISVGDVRYINTDTNIWAEYLQTRGKNKYRDGDEIPPQYLITQNAAHRARYFIEAGGQDASMTLYGGGDTEYALRLFRHYHLPTIFNECAAGDSAMNKTLSEALSQMERFGASNLKYLTKKYPENKDIFGLIYLQKTTFIGKAASLLFNKKLSLSIEKYIRLFPRKLQKYAVHYCVAARIHYGYNHTDI
ncbi:glycosyltransferase family 2 protein [Ignavibacteria bacterium]|jgi:glycosyltransferase involved in cell wall biosynthesis|nr:glycosyltransferase family 2 protein [Bacteroidota bacterium]MCZ2133693.1 glycosyltransferase family 2 protein [Bacteroidota bacterium]